MTAADRAAIAAELAKSGHVVMAGLSESRIDNPVVGFGSDGKQDDQFGYAVAVSGNTAVIGAPYDDVGTHADQGSVYVFVRSGTAWSLQAKLVAPDGRANDQFGHAVAVSGDTVLIGAHQHQTQGYQDGAAYVFVRSDTSWTLQAALSANDGGACNYGYFGSAVALDGDTALVGETRNCTLQYGAAHVFVRSGAGWSEQAVLHAADAQLYQGQFGIAVSLSGDLAVVGDNTWYDGSGGYPGSAYVFARSGTAWTQQAQLFSDDNEIGAYFGANVAASGTTVAVSAPYKTVSGHAQQGAVYVFVQSGGTSWPLQQKITSTDSTDYSYFGGNPGVGAGISLSADTLAISASNGVSGIAGYRAYVFTRSGATWTQRKIIRGGAGNTQIGSAGLALDGNTLVAGGPNNPDCGNAFVQTGSGATWNAQATLSRGCAPTNYYGANFGSAVASDGDTAVVSGNGFMNAGSTTGRSFVFVRQAGGWVLQQELVPADGLPDSSFGAALAVAGDRVAVGAPSHNNSDGSYGTVYLYRRNGAIWSQEAAVSSTGAQNGSFGLAIALSADTLLVGSQYDGGVFGAAYVFARSGTNWSLQATLSASDGAYGDYFGKSVALDGDAALVGAYNASVGAHTGQGAAYVFTRAGGVWTEQQKLSASDGQSNDNFGAAVALRGDDLVVGAPNHQGGAGTSGAAYVFVRSGSAWTEQATLFEYGAQQYGSSVAIDGDTLAVGSPSGYEYLSCGGVYVYWRSGTDWSMHDELANPDVSGGCSGDYFGASVAQNGGNTFIGAPYADGRAPYGNPRDGAAFAYTYVEATTTAIDAIDPEPSEVGSAATVSVTVEAERVAATSGTVTVTANTGESCTVAALSGAAGDTHSTGSCAITFTTLGTHALTASYSGSSTYDPSTSAAVDHEVVKAQSALSIVSADPEPSVVGQPYDVVVALGGFQPGGNVLVSDGAATCTIALPATNCTLTSTAAGSRTLTASYAGDAFNLGSTATASHEVGQAATAVAITADAPDPSEVNKPYTVSVTVSVTAPGVGTPSGEVTVSDGAASCTIILPGTDCTLVSTTVGAKTLTATYAGDANFLGSVSPGEPHQVTNQFTTTTITGASPASPVVGQPVSVGYSVAAASGTPTGNVTVSGPGGESCTGTVAAGACTLTFASAGAKALTANYAGDSNYAPSSAAGSLSVAKGAVDVALDAPTTTVVGQSFAVSVTVAAAAPASGTPTGTVAISAGSANCTATLSGGTGSCSLNIAAPGTATINASYAGDANFDAGSGSATHTVDKGDTNVSVSESPATTVVGQSFTAKATVAAASPAAGTPGGSVTLAAGSANCTATIAGGTASCSLTATAAGSVNVTASYAGDANFNAGSGSHAHTVNKAATSLAITAHTPNPSEIGQAYTVTTALSVSAPGVGTPSGSISVSDGSASCAITLPATSCALTSTSAGTKTLTASYAGDANFLASTSAGVSHTVDKRATTTAIGTIAPSPSVVGQSVAVAYSVTAATGTPTGNVTISAASGESCTGAVAAGTCSLTFTSAGAKTLTASYAGDADYASSSGTGAQTVNKADVTVTASATPASTVVGQPLTVNVSVAAVAPGAGTPGGSVAVAAGSGLTCTATLSGGSGSCTITPTAAAELTIQANYAGNVNFNAGTGSTTHTVDKAATTLSITSHTPDPSAPGQAVTVTVALDVTAPGAGAPSGAVAVGDGVDSCTIALPATSCAIALTTAGTRTLTASYAGDANFTGSTDSVEHVVSSADLAITVDDDVDVVQVGVPIVYRIVASNPGPSAASGAHVGVVIPASLRDASWTCSGTSGGQCPEQGDGDIDATVDLPAGANVTFMLTATVVGDDFDEVVVHAVLTAPAGASDPDTSNNEATDTDAVVLFRDGFDGDAARPVVQAIETLGSGAQAIEYGVEPGTSAATQTVLILRSGQREIARLLQMPLSVGRVMLIWLERDADGAWHAAAPWTNAEVGAAVRLEWNQAQEDAVFVAAGFAVGMP